MGVRTLRLLRQHFDNRISSRRTNFEYPLDLIPPDAYIWGMMMEKIFHSENPSANITELREKTKNVFQQLHQPPF